MHSNNSQLIEKYVEKIASRSLILKNIIKIHFPKINVRPEVFLEKKDLTIIVFAVIFIRYQGTVLAITNMN